MGAVFSAGVPSVKIRSVGSSASLSTSMGRCASPGAAVAAGDVTSVSSLGVAIVAKGVAAFSF
jgi:hypothetical protein